MPEEPQGDQQFTDPTPERLGDLGEEGLLAQVFPRFARGDHTLVGPGDDAALVSAPDGRVVATTDLVVEGRDFRRDWSSAHDVGWKVAAQNLADVAAMGAVPTALLVGLVAPEELEPAWALGLAEGIDEACRGTGATVVGGDLSSGDAIMVSVTALGDLQGRAPVLRSGARPGDVLALAPGAVPGASAAGLDLLLAGHGEDDDAAVRACLAAHRRPTPPYAAGPAAALAGATAMLDVSDGLLRDAGRMARASDVTIDLHDHQVGVWADLLAGAERVLGDTGRAWGWVLTGGEDHGLLAAFPAGTVLPEGFVEVGSVLPRLEGWPPVLVEGHDPAGIVSGTGWDHFGG